MKLLLLFILILPGLALGIPEEDFHGVWKAKALPYFGKMERGEFKNAQGLRIRYFKLLKNAPRSVVIIPGRTEPAVKYAELIFDLRHRNVNIFILSHQGQGESEHLLQDSQKGHVLRFQDYVNDLDVFINNIVVKTPGEKYLIAHSMGGAIASLYMARYPSVFKKAVLIAPMMELNTEPYPETVAGYFAKFLVTIGKGTDYAPDRGPYIPEEDVFETNPYTHSKERFLASKYLFVEYPQLAVGGPTARWVHEALKATKNIHKLKIKTPVLMFQSGLDEIVRPKSQNQFCRSAFCTKIEFSHAKHELLVEEDSIRNEVLKEINLFFGIKLFPE